MILFSEVGDKTFLVAALMAMKHDRMVVFSAAFGALFVMTVLSAVLGHTVPTLLPKRLTSLAASILFFVFGAKLLHEGLQMDPNEGVGAEMSEVEQELAMKEKEHQSDSYSLEMGLPNRRPRSRSQMASPPRSPSQSPARPAPRGGAFRGFLHGTGNLLSLLLSPAWVQTFVMTFLGEWGDRSQIATIAMAAGQDYWWVTLGAVCGHAVCTGAAVIGGRAIAGRVSLKVGTYNASIPSGSNHKLLTPIHSHRWWSRRIPCLRSHLPHRVLLHLERQCFPISRTILDAAPSGSNYIDNMLPFHYHSLQIIISAWT